MGSGRLPGKVLMDICGKPLIWHVLLRVRAARTPDAVIVATTDNPADAPLRKFLEENGVATFVGSESNVLDRFYQTAKAYGVDVVIRLSQC